MLKYASLTFCIAVLITTNTLEFSTMHCRLPDERPLGESFPSGGSHLTLIGASDWGVILSVESLTPLTLAPNMYGQLTKRMCLPDFIARLRLLSTLAISVCNLDYK